MNLWERNGSSNEGSVSRVARCRTLLVIGVAAATSFVSRVGGAEEPAASGDAMNGFRDCQDLIDRNRREQQAWTAALPPKPAITPDDGLVLGAPWKTFFRGIGEAAPVLLPTFVPHLGATVRSGQPAVVLAWPWSIPIGPAHSCTRKTGTFNVASHKMNRIMIEPSLALQDRSVGVSTRIGHRVIIHPTDWVVGVGGGIGSTFELAGFGEPFRASLSPEAVFHFGHCCETGYVTLAVRADFFFAGASTAVPQASLGYTFF